MSYKDNTTVTSGVSMQGINCSFGIKVFVGRGGGATLEIYDGESGAAVLRSLVSISQLTSCKDMFESAIRAKLRNEMNCKEEGNG